MDTLTRSYRKQTSAVTAATIRDMLRIWPTLNFTDLDGTFPDFLAMARLVAESRGATARTLAANYLKAKRLASGVPGEALIVMPAPMNPGAFDTSMRYTTVISAKKSVLAGKPAALAMKDALVMASGSLTRRVLDEGRNVVRESVLSDPAAAGWQRVTSGGCGFCRLLADRGDVYSESTADFASHDHCQCSAAPVYGDAKQVREYEGTTKNVSDADRARTRAYIAEHY